MKRRLFFLIFLISALPVALTAQTVNVCTGQVRTVVNTPSDEMTFGSDGTTLTINGKTYSISDIDSIYIDDATMDDNTVTVTYNGNSAEVVIAGNVANYVTATVSGANVTLLQSADLTEEITYTLQGSSSNGSLYMDGELKATFVLNGLTLTSADSAAINIRDGKRISVELAEGTVNTLEDASGGSQKACFMVNGHTEFKGAGSLYLTGNTGHAFWGDEYVELKKTTGTIVVNSAVKDGFNINQYLEVKGGTLKISGVGDDGIQVSLTDDADDEYNGQIIISGGTLDITVTAAASKGMKCEGQMSVSAGDITIKTTGNGTYDSTDKDVSGCAAIKADSLITIDGGTFTLTSTGTGGKGISSDTEIVINDGTFNITTTGKRYSYGSLTSSSKGIKADGNVTINGGDFTVTTSGGEGSEGIESKSTLYVTGGYIVCTSYDDALNASSSIRISGGNIYARSTTNDGIDSNGTIYISGGVVIACGATQPEGGIDVDNGTFSITGGTVIGLGGETSTPTSSVTTQPVIILSGSSYTQNSYITLNASDGTNILAFRVPTSYNQATLLLSHASLSTGSTYTISSGATVSGGTEWEGLTTDATVSGGTSVASLTLSSIVTTSGNTGGWGGGGGGGGGGGWGGGGGGRW